MKRYFIELSYNGEKYKGWQIQPNAPTVQDTIEKALSTVLREPVSVTGCGRTDSGVHAKYFVAHFDCTQPINDEEAFCYKLNSFLPKDIAFFSINKMNSDAHARFGAIERSYEYHVLLKKDVFAHKLATKLNFTPDFDLMNRAAIKLYDYTDFTSFSKLHTEVKTNNCDVRKAYWEKVNDAHWIFHISADRFLRNMVRAIVGTLLEVGKKKLTLEQFEKVILSKNRGEAGTSVPAHGLFLTGVNYPYF